MLYMYKHNKCTFLSNSIYIWINRKTKQLQMTQQNLVNMACKLSFLADYTRAYPEYNAFKLLL